MNNHINAAIQVLPTCTGKHPYAIVDEAIAAIAASGLKYKVCPFETVVEGSYDEVMAVIRKAQDACYAAGAESVITNLKIQTDAAHAVTIGDKMDKYE